MSSSFECDEISGELNGSDSMRGILHIDDSEVDHAVLTRSFKRVGIGAALYWCKNARDTRAFLNHEGDESKQATPRPALILLDLSLPGENGLSILKTLKSSPQFASIPVIILTSSTYPGDIEACYALGANSYLVKPLDSRDMDRPAKAFAQFWLVHALLPAANNRQSNCIYGKGDT